MPEVGITCIRCKKTYTFDLTSDQVADLLDRTKYVQNVLPELTPDQRELFISQVCGTCFDAMFGEEDIDKH